MKVLKKDEIDRVVRLMPEEDGKKNDICDWVDCRHTTCRECIVDEYVTESKRVYRDGLTYDEAFQFLEDK